MLEFLDLTPGSVSVLGMMNDVGHHVQLLIDRDVLWERWFACHPASTQAACALQRRS